MNTECGNIVTGAIKFGNISFGVFVAAVWLSILFNANLYAKKNFSSGQSGLLFIRSVFRSVSPN